MTKWRSKNLFGISSTDRKAVVPIYNWRVSDRGTGLGEASHGQLLLDHLHHELG